MTRFLGAAVTLCFAAAPVLAQVDVRLAAPESVAPFTTAAPLAAAATLAAPLTSPSALGAVSIDAPTPSLAFAAPAAVATVPAAAVAAQAPEAAAAEAATTGIELSITPAVSAPTAAPATRAPSTLLTALVEAVRPAASRAASSASRRWGAFFDGGGRDEARAGAVAASEGRANSVLPRFAGTLTAAPVAIPAPRPVRRRVAAGLTVALTALLVFAVPVPAFAATAAVAAAPLFTTAGTMSALSALHPAVSALSAAIGVVYGLTAARRADGQTPTSGSVFSSALRYGVIGGVGTYALMGMAQSALTGFSMMPSVNPISTALVTAALAHTAFEGSFRLPTTTSADRIFSVFPAVAAAFGLNAYTIVQFVAAASWPHALMAGALSLTGLVAAFYATLFTPGRSDPDGPARMARGFVLLSLMGGLALALTNPWFSLPFATLAAWGFWDAMSAGFAEFRSALTALVASLRRPAAPPAPPAPATPPTAPVPPPTEPPTAPKA